MDNQRTFLVIALSIILVMLWQAWEREHPGAPTVTSTATPQPSDDKYPAPPSANTAPKTQEQESAARGERIHVTTDLIDAYIDTVGGDLRDLSLRKYTVAVKNPEPFQLLTDRGSELFFIQSGLIGADGDYPNHKTTYTAERAQYVLPSDQMQLEVPLHWRDGNLDVTKVYVFNRDSYVVTVRYDIRNHGKSPRQAFDYTQFVRSHVEQHSFFSVAPSYVGGAIYSPDKKYQEVTLKEIGEHWPERTVAGGWVAMMQHYFVGAVLPPPAAPQIFYAEEAAPGHYALGKKGATPVTINPGQLGQLSERYYLGPKEQDRLEEAAPGLKRTVDYGWTTIVAAPLYLVLEWLHHWVGNWGWSIILLTLLIKLVFYPLSAASYKSMAQMRKMQPRLTALKERHADDRARLNQAMMELYRTEKINPLGGCLPIVIQIPVFIALYKVLLESVELRQAPFIGWIGDLSIPDPHFVLPIVMGITMVIQQFLTPSPLDPLQKKIMMALPVLFTTFFLFFPAGLVLYWVVNNVLSITQQWWITRQYDTAKR